MPTTAPCALQRAYLQLREAGRDEDITALTDLMNDHTKSTRVAAQEARTAFGIHITHNTFTSHRNGTCAACARAQADGQDPTNYDPTPNGHKVGPTYPYARKADEKTDPVTFSRVKPRMEQDEDGGVILKDVPLYTPLMLDDDLSPLLVQFGLNPERYEVVADSFSMWMQSASNNDGGRDLVYLYSAKFRRVGQVEPGRSNQETLDAWRSVLLKTSEPVKPVYSSSAGPVGTYTLWPSDLQLGKTRTKEAVHNFQVGITEGLNECARLMDAGTPIEGIHIGWGGDETEGVCNNYTNQTHIIELNQSEQLELDTDLRIWALKEAFELGLPVSASSVISNHGEGWVRNGSKDVVTTKSDNASTHIARQVKRLFDELAAHGVPKVDWTIGSAQNADPGLVVTLSGEQVYTSHGHMEKGRGKSTELRTKSAIENQLLGDIMAERRLLDVRLFVMAHYHHHYTIEDRGRVIMGLPALEAERSSEYMLAQFGVWSPPGLVGMLVGRFDHRPYRHLNVFGSRPFEADEIELEVPLLRAA